MSAGTSIKFDRRSYYFKNLIYNSYWDLTGNYK